MAGRVAHQSGSRHLTLQIAQHHHFANGWGIFPLHRCIIHTYIFVSAYPVSGSNRKTAAKLLLVQRGHKHRYTHPPDIRMMPGEASHIAATRDAARMPPTYIVFPSVPIYIYTYIFSFPSGGPPRKSKAKTISHWCECMCLVGCVNIHISVSVVLQCESIFEL